MRLNKFVASATNLSRRAADKAAEEGRVYVNGRAVGAGFDVKDNDKVTLDGKPLTSPTETKVVILNKPVGYVVSRNGQGNKTIYELLPTDLQNLNPVGRLDKDSSGLLVLTNDGKLANQLTHPSFQKDKVYQVQLDKSLKIEDKQQIENGVKLEDGISKLKLNGDNHNWIVTMSEGRNRQIRRTFEALGYKVTKLHRTEFGKYKLEDLNIGQYTSA